MKQIKRITARIEFTNGEVVDICYPEFAWPAPPVGPIKREWPDCPVGSSNISQCSKFNLNFEEAFSGPVTPSTPWPDKPWEV